MKTVSLNSLPKVEPRESKFSLDEVIDVISRKDKDCDCFGVNGDIFEIMLCLANEIRQIKYPQQILDIP